MNIESADDVLGVVLGKLDGVRKQGGYWMARCPAHDDHQASLSIRLGTEQPVILHCHAGCDPADALDRIGLTLADVSAPNGNHQPDGEWTPRGPAIAVYSYTDQAGELLFQVCRTADKQFPQRRPDRSAKSGWRWNTTRVPRVPYHLGPLIAGVAAGHTIYVCEGEKDVHAVEAAGGVATCNPGGAGKWRSEFDQFFTGATVVIVADRDDPGRKHAHAVAQHLRKVASSVTVVEAVNGKDAADHLAAGHDLTEFQTHESRDPSPPAVTGVTAPANVSLPDASQPYEVDDRGCLTWNKPTQNGPVPVTLATFDACIAEEVTQDDGTEQTLTWRLNVTAADGRTGQVEITPDQLGRPQQWAVRAVGLSALVMPGLSVADHLRVAVQSRSRNPARRTVFTHTGWRQIGGCWWYLTNSGALGAKGLDEAVTVELGPLSGYALPDVTDVTALREAVAISLGLLDLAPDTVTVPLLAPAYRAPLPLPPDCSVWFYVRSGTFKTAVTALAQQHFGASMDPQNLPGNWTSTANALEAQAYLLNGALFVVDDYSPDATKVDAQRRAVAADRLVRGSANHSGRGRLRPDGTIRPVKPPRAQILTSAEDVPPGVESMRARSLVAEVMPGDVAITRLTAAQEAARSGVLALAMAGYVQSLAKRYNADNRLPSALAATRDDYRGRARADGHPRYALNIASLAVGWHEFLGFAGASGAISAEDRDAYWARAWKALCDIGADQDRYRRDADPVSIYLKSLAALIAEGRAHLAAPHGGCPAENPGRWGWREGVAGGEPQMLPRGDLVGWVDDDDVYLQPDAAYRAARQFAEGSSNSLGISQIALHKHLAERQLLASVGGPGHLTVQRNLGGQRNRRVIHMTVRSFEGGGHQ